MYKEKTENVEVYFICYKKDEMDLVETYYDEVLNVHYWYFNAYLAYELWKQKFKEMELGELSKTLLIVAASRYIIYKIENEDYNDNKEYKRLIRDMKKVQPQLDKIIKENEILINL